MIFNKTKLATLLSEVIVVSLALSSCGGSGSGSGSGGSSTPAPVNGPAYIMAYYPNYYGYFNNNTVSADIVLAGHAIPEPSYVIPGISFGYPSFNNGTPSSAPQGITNQDLQNKLSGIDALSYGFFKLNTNGSIQFADSYADLLATGTTWPYIPSSTTMQVYNLQLGPSIIGVEPTTDTVHYGGFEAFMKMKKPNGNLDKFISIGGWSGAAWQANLNSQANITNFVDSIQQLHSVSSFDGIDLDVENAPGSFNTTSSFYAYLNGSLMTVIQHLHIAMPNLKITLTLQADPAILNSIGTKLKASIGNLAGVQLMTYDFHGAFDYTGSSGTTGFNSSLYNDPASPFGTSEFSVNASVEILAKYIPYNKISLGVPAYGRAAITGVPPTNGGLFQQYDNTSIVLPGDLDNTICSSTLGSTTACSGTFEYRYILSQMLTNGFVESVRTVNGTNNATTAFATSWTVQPGVTIDGITPVGIASNYPVIQAKNVFISYISASVAKSYGQYAAKKGLKGAIVWDIMGDVPYADTTHSLLYNFRQGYESK